MWQMLSLPAFGPHPALLSRRQLSLNWARLPSGAASSASWGRRRAQVVVCGRQPGQGEHNFGLPEDGFDKETASMVLRLLTVRAVQRLLVQLQEINQAHAQYLNHFAAEHRPQEGNEFLLKLFAEPGKEVTDPITRSVHTIDPQNLAHRILQAREDIAENLATGFSEYASRESTAVLRKHLGRSMQANPLGSLGGGGSGGGGSPGGGGGGRDGPGYRRGSPKKGPP